MMFRWLTLENRDGIFGRFWASMTYTVDGKNPAPLMGYKRAIYLHKQNRIPLSGAVFFHQPYV